MTDRVVQSSSGSQSPNVSGDGNTILFDAKKRLANEAKTLLAIVSIIPEVTRKSGVSAKPLDYSKDVRKKIEGRFQDHQSELKSHLADLEVLYRGAYEEAKRNSSMDEFQIEEACNLLRNLSVKVLSENDENPVAALRELTRHFKEEFASSDAEEFSEQAIEYFLYRQLIECNVFPNTR
jgi:hypothetical protein